MNLVGVRVLDFSPDGETYVMVVTFEATQARWDVFTVVDERNRKDLPRVGSGLRSSVPEAWGAARRAVINAHKKWQKENQE
jgi:hypothetical protein